MKNPFVVFNEIRKAYLRYLDSPFRLRYDALLQERARLLDRDGQLYRTPLFEPVSPYESSGQTIQGACAQLGVSQDVATLLTMGAGNGSGLLRPNDELYRHQLEAWQHTRNGRAVVVTSGTGSGKTECYLIPVFASLIEESLSWPAPPQAPPTNFWWQRGRRYSQREHESGGRLPAVRALLLFPLNALIEDQLGRIRRAIDQSSVRSWLDAHRSGNRIWFGRYAGRTPVSGDPQDQNRRRELKARLQRMENEWNAAVASGDPQVLQYFADPRGGEMWSRWDMQEAAPDILITNYSMLNIMLMRSVENGIFDQTRAWLAQSPKHVFHLVVDELHTYRGTPGTEVGYLLRALLLRLGLTPDSEQLRIIATSASIEKNAPDSLAYLEDFFGRDRQSFEIVPGYPKPFPPNPSGLASVQGAFEAFELTLVDDAPAPAASALANALGVTDAATPEQTIAACLESANALDPIRNALSGIGGPFTDEQLAQSVFGSSSTNAIAAARGLIRALVHARNSRGLAPLPLRSHMFFHNAGRLWTCVNPSCSGRTGVTPPGASPPTVGKLFTEPHPRCDACSARVLELLYCQPCGDVFLGGYKKEDGNNAWHLTPDYPNLENVPDRTASLERKFGEYLVFWPSGTRPLYKAGSNGRREWQGDGNDYQWTHAELEYSSGRLAQVRRANPPNGFGRGYVFISSAATPSPAAVLRADEANAFASKCPHCGADWARRRRLRSPIRDLGSGFQRVVQLLSDALVRRVPDLRSRKLVLFSDSRQDAAKLSTGIKRDHYLDTVRQIAFSFLRNASHAAAAANAAALQTFQRATELLNLETQLNQSGLNAAERQRRIELLGQLPANVRGEISQYAVAGGALPASLTPPPALAPYAAIQFMQLVNAVRDGLLELGMNPGGPQASTTSYAPQQGQRVFWAELFDWQQNPPVYRQGLQPLQQTLQAIIEESLFKSLIEDVLFASGSRDFESLRLGFVWLDDAGPQNLRDEATASVIRRLLQGRMWQLPALNLEGNAARPDSPQYIRMLLDPIATRLGTSQATLEGQVVTRLGGALGAWRVNLTALRIVTPRPTAQNTLTTYGCTRCGRIHLHQSGGTCTACFGAVSPNVIAHSLAQDPEDFYEYLARTDEAPFRLACEELTGQTDAGARRDRQRQFQEVFLQGEVPAVQGIDLLSVTTTMEAGVDIGALQAIGMANMPPVRFNYQQRVGRAGRRGHGLSVAMTLCRGRSHDDYYFERPRLITAEPPPPPYVDVSSPPIARRVINKEVLRRAFATIPLIPTTDNVHGEFGLVRDWNQHQPVIAAWIAANQQEIEAVCRAVLHRTPFGAAAALQQVVQSVMQTLVAEVSATAAHSNPDDALSEHLAGDGILPMFGFPTRVRYLYYWWPQRLPPEVGVIDRQLDIAISQFAPGAQSVKDDHLYTSVGVVDFRWNQNNVTPSPDPLGPAIPVGICRRCQALVESPYNQNQPGCPYCAAAVGPGGYRITELSEPPGFCTWFSFGDVEFSGGFEFTPRALRARLSAQVQSPVSHGNAIFDRMSGRVYRINDNGGDDFVFEKQAGSHVWIVQDAVDQARMDLPQRQRGAPLPQVDRNVPPITRALAASLTTDVLTVGLQACPVGLTLNPSVPEARAAWYSFGFLLRRAAAVTLDIAESELDLGIQPVLDPSSPFAQPSAKVFISDSLENGAGYSTHLGDPARFPALLQFMLDPTDPRQFYSGIAAGTHAAHCDTSCPRCLREFGNMAYHSLLDWRLGLDIVRLALYTGAPIDFSPAYWQPHASQQAASYFAGLQLTPTTFGGLDAGVNTVRQEATIIIHPLWDKDPSNWRPEVAAAATAAQQAGLEPRFKSVFHIVRFPYE